MRAACLKGGRISIETLPDPQPRQGQILVRPLFNGICGSDLSLRKQMAAAEAEVAATDLPVIVPGHEFSAEVMDVPKAVRTDLNPGDIITALPFTHDHEGPQTIGISPGHQGGLATLSCVDAVRAFKVPEGVAPDLAAREHLAAVEGDAAVDDVQVAGRRELSGDEDERREVCEYRSVLHEVDERLRGPCLPLDGL